MTNFATQSFAALAALVLAVGLWAPTIAPVAHANTGIAVVTAPEMA